MSRIQEIIDDLTARKRSISCNGKAGLLLYMEELGFSWTEGKTDGHKVFSHKFLTKDTSGQFTTHSIDCGHKPKRNMKFQYVVNTIRVLRKYESNLVDYLKIKG